METVMIIIQWNEELDKYIAIEDIWGHQYSVRDSVSDYFTGKREPHHLPLPVKFKGEADDR
jgi:hypothetical protein